MNHADFKLDIFQGIADGGMHLFLLDGTKWNVDPEDIPTVLTWVPGATVRITFMDGESFYPYMLYHTGTGSFVRAREDQ